MRRVRPWLLVLLAAAALAQGGCVELRERLTLEREGQGTYALTLRWNADLLQRARETVGERAFAAFEGRALPLRLEDWRDGLQGLDGIKVVVLTESIDDGGWKTLNLELSFAALADLRRWELFGRRTLRCVATADPPRGRLVMEPFARLPVLDPLLEFAAARRAGLLGGAPGDPDALARLGLEPVALDLVERMLAPHLARIALVIRVAPAGRVISAGERATAIEQREAQFGWTWADLVAAKIRSVELAWTLGEFDKIPVVEWSGDAPVPAPDPAPVPAPAQDPAAPVPAAPTPQGQDGG